MPDDRHETEADAARTRIVGLLHYVRHMVALGQKAVLRVDQFGGLVMPEQALKGRVGIHHDRQDEDGPVWLSVARLKRRPPPAAPDEIAAWISVPNDPAGKPDVEPFRIVTIPLEQAEEEVRRGILAAEDVQVPPDDAGVDRERMRDAIYRLERLPQVGEAICEYLDGPWRRWVDEERPRRETIGIYDRLFSLRQALELEGAESPQELVWGIGVARWRTGRGVIDRPLIEQLVEIDLDATDGTLRIRPRAVEPQFVVAPYSELECEGADQAHDFGRRFLADRGPDSELSPFVAGSFEAALRHAATVLDSQGVYLPDEPGRDAEDRDLPAPGPNLVVSDTWVLFSRRRSDAPILSDLERLKEAVEKVEALPAAARALVTEPADESLPGAAASGSSGAGTAACSAGSLAHDGTRVEPASDELYFPKAYNEAQESIIRKLERADGVVVQGPPGTGKTHTIANIICHYMATGRRVLVTSKGESALAVLRDHLPEEVRGLAISLLTSEKEGLKQLEAAVTTLVNLATTIRPRGLERQVSSLEQRIRELRHASAAAEQELRQWARKHLKRVDVGAQQPLLPIELARRVCEDGARHAWFPDRLDTEPARKPAFSREDIAALRAARRALGADLGRPVEELPSADDLPDEATMVALHRDRLNARALDERRESGDLPVMATSPPDALARAKALALCLRGIRRALEALQGEAAWLRPLFDAWCRDGADSAASRTFNRVLAPLEAVVKEREDVIAHPVEIGDELLHDRAVLEAVERGASGRSPVRFLGIGQSAVKARLSSIRVEGRAPDTTAEWQLVQRHVVWRRNVTSLASRWNALRAELPLPEVTDEGLATGLWFARSLERIQEAMAAAFEHRPKVLSDLPVLFPAGLDAEAATTELAACERAMRAVEHALERARLSSGQQRIESLREVFSRIDAPVARAIVEFLEQRIGSRQQHDEQVAARWRTLAAEVGRLQSLRPHFETVERVTDRIRRSGAAQWARLLSSEPVDRDREDDPLLPADWSDTWRWARLRAYLEAIDGRGRIAELSRMLLDNDRAMKRAFRKVVQLRTHLGLNRRISGPVAGALIRFAEAIRRIGAGTGIRARRYRRDARAAMTRSYEAVPCWIMPTWRVSESLPADLGSFDLVIVDEASQSDITAAPALLRGARILVVGDDKQVSPTAAFIEERKILQLEHQFLNDQPYEELLLPGASLYTLAKAMFPRQTVLLREHFRCVEPIIRFSFQFYNEPLIPLRVPTALERIDPPLVDVFVKNGLRDRKGLNEPEAQAITDEIEKLVSDPAYERRSIGVVSLVGAKQAHYVQQLLLERIGEEMFDRHQIACGDSATFQGKERDIMFVSMVECPRTQRAKTTLEFEQRYNVALSRARDRMYLFRSVEPEVLRPDDLKARAIRHFHSPMPGNAEAAAELRDLCQSGFETDVFDRLTQLGYRVMPQVAVGGYHIDLVVEGEEGRRLAVELDGDRYHPPEQWADDFRRQRVLERVGWTFWRCWGSSFALDPDACMQDLIGRLEELGIRPIGAAAPQSRWTEHRVIGEAQPGGDASAANEEGAPEAAAESDTRTASGVAHRDVVAERTEVDRRAGEKERDHTSGMTFEEEPVVEVGDQVQVIFPDDPGRKITLRISAHEHDPANFVVHASRPLATALLGHGVDDEVEVHIDESRTRTAVVMRIEKQEAESVSTA